MKTNALVRLAAVGLLLAGVSFGTVHSAPQPAEAGEHSEESAAPLAVRGLDPVLLISGKEVAGSGTFTAIHGPYHYHFASAATRKQFLAKPARYAVQGEGNCIVAPNAAANPALFAVHGGKIYVFAAEHCMAHFRKEPEKFVAALNAANDAASPKRKRNVAILVWSGAEVLDFAGPAEAFSAADHGRAFRVYTVAATNHVIRAQGGLLVKPEFTLANCPRPDILVVPGGNTLPATEDAKFVAWVKEASEKAEIVLSVCTGAFVLAEAGLLDGTTVTTHHSSLDRLRQRVPNATIVSGRRFVDNGKIVTSGGVSAGIDGALHVIERLRGPEVARWTAEEWMEYRRAPTTGAK